MPRRIPDYPDAYEYWNSFMSLGSFLTFFSLIIFIYILAFNVFNPQNYNYKKTDMGWNSTNLTLWELINCNSFLRHYPGDRTISYKVSYK